MNAYDDGDTIVVDVMRHPKMFARDRTGPSEGSATLDRWTVDLAGRSFRAWTSALSASGIGTAMLPSAEPSSATLCKHDFLRGSTHSRCFGAETALGEFVFHPSSPDAAGGDGVLMGYVYDRHADRSELAILDAHTVQGVASIKLPHRVPAVLHDNWVPTVNSKQRRTTESRRGSNVE